LFKQINRKAENKKRHLRVRNRVTGTSERPRLSVYRSLNNIYAQIIDDTEGITLAAASSLDSGSGGNIEAAKLVGKAIAEVAADKGIKQVVFDRGGRIYHGRVKAFAEAAREAGLDF